jgi:hypothetical protein
MANWASGRRLKKAPFSNTILKVTYIALSLPTDNLGRTSLDAGQLLCNCREEVVLKMCLLVTSERRMFRLEC